MTCKCTHEESEHCPKGFLGVIRTQRACRDIFCECREFSEEVKVERKSWAVACMGFFGRKQGQDLPAFKKELDALTDKDKQDIIDGFARECNLEVFIPTA